MRTALSALLALIPIAMAGQDGWHMDTAFTLANEMLDPVVSPNQQSSHMHKIFGGSRFGASYEFQEYASASCSSLALQVDKSNYWLPNLYWINDNNQFIQIADGMRFYYFLGNPGEQRPVPFPAGLRMIAGNPDLKGDVPFPQKYTCHRNLKRTDSIASQNFNYETSCPGGLKITLMFPQCWDGINLYKSDQSHVAWVVDGFCPFSHPVRVPQILFENTFWVDDVAPGQPLKGHLAWANGDTTGGGLHGDFVNGWDLDVLGAALNSSACGIGSGESRTIQSCPIFAPYWDISAGSKCQPEKGILQDPVTNSDLVVRPSLPGCNKLWASGPKPTCDSTPQGTGLAAVSGIDGPLLAATPVGLVLSTTPGWHALGCARKTPGFGSTTSYWDSAMTIDMCQANCLRSGQPYAAVGLVSGSKSQCICASEMNATATIATNTCNLPCPGDKSTTCGGQFAYNVFYAGTSTGTVTADNTTDPVTDASGVSYLGCLNTRTPSKAMYSFTSGAMTLEVCNEGCHAKNASWSALINGKTCTCGQTLSTESAQFVGNSNCNTPCNGNSTQMCGASSHASIYNLTRATFAKSNVVHYAGWQGCYPGPQSLLPGYRYDATNMDQAQCVNACGELSYTYAGLVNGQRCLCSNSTMDASTRLPDSQCQSACAGNSALICGGGSSIDLYTTAPQTAIAAVAATKESGYAGCFSGNTLPDYQYSSHSMTVDLCRGACTQFGYPYAALTKQTVCSCGRSMPNATSQLPAPRYCTAPCNGNTNQTCGSGWTMDVYASSSSATGNNAPAGEPATSTSSAYVGCYNGVSMSDYLFALGTMTVDVCRSSCNELGYALASLDSGKNCRCGNAWNSPTVLPDSSCSKPCAGNSSQICGSSGISSVYKTQGAPALSTHPANWAGCYADSSTRTLDGYAYSSSSMTVDTCTSACRQQNYAYAGLESGNRCYCGSTLAAARKPSVLCSSACVGNARQTCGGSWLLDVFKTAGNVTASNTTDPQTAAPASSSSATCYGDYNALTGPTYASSLMSLDICAAWCGVQNTTLAGVRNGKQCMCGTASPRQVLASDQCATACSGDASQNCGKNWTVNVISAAGQSKTGLNLVVNSTTGYAGCITDVPNTVFSYRPYGGSSLTPQFCIDQCRSVGAAYAGLENGSNCFCGPAPSARSGVYQVADSECSMACKGDATKTCGGSWRLGLYDLSVAPAGTTIKSQEGLQGCFAPGSFASSNTFSYTSRSMTPNLCRQTCRIKGYSVAGVAGGSTCQCGSAPTYGALQAPAVCGTACAGDRNSTCGSSTSTAWSIYDTTGPGALLSTSGYTNDYQGCFLDGGSSSTKALQGWSWWSGGMTTDLCAMACTQRGFPVSGTQSSSYCYCGAQLPATGLAPSSACNRACSGVATQMCGGTSTALSVRLAVGGSNGTVGTNATSIVGSASSTAPTQVGTTAAATQSANTTRASSVSAAGSSGSVIHLGSAMSSASVSSSSTASSSATFHSPSVSFGAQPTASASSTKNATGVSSKLIPVNSSTATPLDTSNPSAATLIAISPSASASDAVSPISTSSCTAPAGSSNATATVTTGPGYLGCYRGNTTSFNSAIMQHMSTMSPPVCQTWCYANGYAMSALSEGNACGCGNDVASMTAVGSGACSSPCIGASSGTCGGPENAYSVYRSLLNAPKPR